MKMEKGHMKMTYNQLLEV